MRDVVYIYRLINPINKSIFYIGATINPRARISSHLSNATIPTIDKLKRSGVSAEMEIIEECTVHQSFKKEKYWIDKYEKEGVVLENRYRNPTYSINIGRNPVSDKKLQVALYLIQSDIDKLGGVPAVQEIAYAAIDKRVKSKK